MHGPVSFSFKTLLILSIIRCFSISCSSLQQAKDALNQAEHELFEHKLNYAAAMRQWKRRHHFLAETPHATLQAEEQAIENKINAAKHLEKKIESLLAAQETVKTARERHTEMLDKISK